MSANSHGHTTAAWTGVTVSFLGFMLAGVAMVIPSPILVTIGLVLAAAGAVVGKLMSAAGFGKKPATHAAPAAKESVSSSVSA
ncbi:hypothetical protein DN069_16740 [Streptacidiphilus pinicola]|uniref:Uncharacterized protein n=1 Tax=Streptacidiphilus pinicola TaxID=2219663 RepID=A0A2X0IHG5_9ACTN|nr:HGxxPAAW family protein [Streptacidiphilus pinicola]RAG84494.1 hypothetical protein DN069_16740 [Streptacidiphilus pinicola]